MNAKNTGTCAFFKKSKMVTWANPVNRHSVLSTFGDKNCGIYAGSCHLTTQNAVNYSTLCAVYVQFLNERCFHTFLAFFNQKRRYGLKLDDSVARKEAGGRRKYDDERCWWGAFTQTRLHTEAFMYRSFYIEKSLYRLAFTRRNFYTERNLYTEGLVRTDAFTHRNLYTKEILHTNAFTQRSFYTQTRLHTEAFTQKSLYTEELLDTRAFTHRSEAVTHRRCYTKKSLHREL